MTAAPKQLHPQHPAALWAQQTSWDSIEWSEWIADLPWSKRPESERLPWRRNTWILYKAQSHFTTLLEFSCQSSSHGRQRGCLRWGPAETVRRLRTGTTTDTWLRSLHVHSATVAVVDPWAKRHALICPYHLGKRKHVMMKFEENLIGLLCWKRSALGAILWIVPFCILESMVLPWEPWEPWPWIQQIELHAVSLPRCLTIYDNVVQARSWALWDATGWCRMV